MPISLNTGGAAGTKLVLTSDVTGVGNDLVISNNNAELDTLSTVPTGAGTTLNLTAAAQDAEIELDGITITNSTNVFEDAIQDISLTVLATTPADKNVGLTVATDKKAAETNIRAFIKSYNDLVDQVTELTRGRGYGVQWLL